MPNQGRRASTSRKTLSAAPRSSSHRGAWDLGGLDLVGAGLLHPQRPRPRGPPRTKPVSLRYRFLAPDIAEAGRCRCSSGRSLRLGQRAGEDPADIKAGRSPPGCRRLLASTPSPSRNPWVEYQRRGRSSKVLARCLAEPERAALFSTAVVDFLEAVGQDASSPREPSAPLVVRPHRYPPLVEPPVVASGVR
jgi:hypothetical protein